MVKFSKVPCGEANSSTTYSLTHSEGQEITFFAVNPAIMSTTSITNIYFDLSIEISGLILYLEQ